MFLSRKTLVSANKQGLNNYSLPNLYVWTEFLSAAAFIPNSINIVKYWKLE